MNIIVKPNALRGQEVNMSLRNLLYHILKYLAESTDNSLVLDEEAGLVVIGTEKVLTHLKTHLKLLKWVIFITS